MMMCHNAADFPQGRAWIELDRSALLHNVRVLRALLPKGCELMPAVKANAYGHGAALVAGELQRAGIGSFCVASAAEAVELRKAGITGEILILGYTHPRQFSLLRHFHLTQTVLDHDYAELLNRSGRTVRTAAAIIDPRIFPIPPSTTNTRIRIDVLKSNFLGTIVE